MCIRDRTSTLVYENSGRWREYEGGVQDWLTQAKRAKEFGSQSQLLKTPPLQTTKKLALLPNAIGQAASKVKPPPPVKLTFKEQKELDALPEQMAEKEARQNSIHQTLNDARIFQKEPLKAKELAQELIQLETTIADMLSRWEALTLRQEGQVGEKTRS